MLSWPVMPDTLNRQPLAELLLDQGPACHWIADPAGVFVRVYGNSTPVFGRTAAELAGRSVAEVLDSDTAAAWMDRYRRALQGDSQLLRERRDKNVWFVSVFPVAVDGATRYAGGLARDVSPWAVAETELRHTVLGALKSQEFERAMLSKFLHDSVGQNLTALGLQLDLIRMDLSSISPDTCNR